MILVYLFEVGLALLYILWFCVYIACYILNIISSALTGSFADLPIRQTGLFSASDTDSPVGLGLELICV